MEVQGKTVINNMQIETSSGTVYWQEEEPTNPKDGDTWFKVINGKATNAYNRENGEWVDVEFASQVIAEELVGKIITGAEINGATVNGTTINGGEVNGGRFLNQYTFSQTNGRIDGFIDIKDGVLAARNEYIDEPSEVVRQNVGVVVQNGGLFTDNTVYDPDGTQTSFTGASMEGGILTLSKIDGTGTFNGMLDAKLLESIGTVKTKTVNIPNNANFQNASIVYYRWGQFVIARFYFDLLKVDGYVGLAAHETGYRPISLPMASGILPSTAGPSRYCVIYSNNAGWRLIPSDAPKVTLGTIQGSIMYLTNDAWQDA
mgnify:CR=1 FL=1